MLAIRLLCASLLALLAGGALAASAGAAAPSVVGNLRVATDSEPRFPNAAATAGRHAFVVLQAWQDDRLRQLKAANPRLVVLVYKNLSFSARDVAASGQSASGVPYSEAVKHPDWFLLDRRGRRFASWSYDWNLAMDVGRPAYQRRWADNVERELAAAPWDGVFIDDVSPTMKYHRDPHDIAQYRTDRAYAAATRSALETIAPRIRATGKLAFGNLGAWSEYPSEVNEFLDFLDGGLDEFFGKWGDKPGKGYADAARWKVGLDNLRRAQRAGKTFLAVTHSRRTDGAAARYGYASVLLGAEGRAAFALHDDYGTETWFPEYDIPLGTPTGPAEADASGVYRRRFTGGLVVVNPTETTRRVDLGGRFTGSGLTRASSVVLRPKRALVLASAD